MAYLVETHLTKHHRQSSWGSGSEAYTLTCPCVPLVYATRLIQRTLDSHTWPARTQHLDSRQATPARAHALDRARRPREMSGPPRSTGLSLPVSSAEAARQGRAAAAAGASQARPLGPTKSASHTGTAAPPGRLAKKKKAGRGRMMMGAFLYPGCRAARKHRAVRSPRVLCLFGRPVRAVKVFYSLSSPRTDAPQSISTPPLSVNTPTEATSAFLAVLDPALAPPPAPPPQPAPTPSQQQQQQQPNTYSCIARLSAPVWVQLMGQTADRDEAADASGKRDRKSVV